MCFRICVAVAICINHFAVDRILGLLSSSLLFECSPMHETWEENPADLVTWNCPGLLCAQNQANGVVWRSPGCLLLIASHKMLVSVA